MGELRELLESLHGADIAQVVQTVRIEQQLQLLRLMTVPKAAETLQELDSEQQAELLLELDRLTAARVLNEMSNDDLADLLANITPDQVTRILSLMRVDDAADIRGLMRYPEDTAGGLMTNEFIALHQDLTADQAIETLRELAPDAETIYYVYVVNREKTLVGVLSLRDLIVAPPQQPLAAVMKRNIIRVQADTDQEEVARMVSKYDLLALPVVDENDVLLGIVTVDDVIDVIEEEANEDILRLAANVSETEREFEMPAWYRAKKRLPWLIVLLFGGLLAGNIIQTFEQTLVSVAALAYFITVMAGEAGNVATQSLAVIVRGIATGEINNRGVWRVIGKEVEVGLLVGVICGLVLAITATVWQHSLGLGIVVGVSLSLSMMIATIFGAFFPLVIHRMGLDPAVASGPFITTLNDVISMLIYFSFATALIAWL